MIGDFREGARPGADAGLFAATHWSLVLRAQDKSEVALNTLCQTYRPALIKWLRIRGYNPEDAEDHVHGFLAHLLGKDSLKNIAQAKGRFRTFLQQCPKNYLTDQHDKHTAEKRGGGEAIESLDATADDGRKVHDPASNDAAPDLECDRAWAHAVLETAKRRLEGECARQGHSAL